MSRVPALIERTSLAASGLLRQASRTMILTPLRTLQRGLHIVDRRHFVAQADFVLQLGVDRHDVVVPLKLHAVARVVEQRGVGVFGVSGELRDGLIHLTLLGVELERHLKADRRSACATSVASLAGLVSAGVFL